MKGASRIYRSERKKRMLDLILGVMGVILLVVGIMEIFDGIKKKNFGSSFCTGGGMIVFGVIITLAWISSMFS